MVGSESRSHFDHGLLREENLDPWKTTKECHVGSPRGVPGRGKGDEYSPIRIECGSHARQYSIGVNEMLEAVLADNDIALEPPRKLLCEPDAVAHTQVRCSTTGSIQSTLININSYDLTCSGLTKCYGLIPKPASEVENDLV